MYSQKRLSQASFYTIQCCGSGSGIRDEQPGSYFLDGWKKVGAGIRDKHPGSATKTQYHINISKQNDLYGVIIFCGEVQNYICNHLAASIRQMAIRI
jgi:hypothetical protein